MRFFRDFAEIPGAIILVLLSWFQIYILGYSQAQVLEGKILALKNEMYNVCVRISNLEFMADVGGNSCSRLHYAPERQSDWHFTFPMVSDFARQVEGIVFPIGLTLFVGGLVYRLWIWRSDQSE